MTLKSINFNQFLDFIYSNKSPKFLVNSSILERQSSSIDFYKKGNKIKIKKKNLGKFTEYCKGKVTSECISRGKNSSDPKIRKRATFADNARKWKHYNGGIINRYIDFNNFIKKN